MSWTSEGYPSDLRSAGQAAYQAPDGGRIVSVQESNLVHISRTGNLAEKGDPVYATNLVGVAVNSPGSATDYVGVDTGGVYYLLVTPEEDDVSVGQRLYINSSGLLTDADAGNVTFGYALEAIDTSETYEATLIPVKIQGA